MQNISEYGKEMTQLQTSPGHLKEEIYTLVEHHVMAHMYMCVGCGCSLLLDICIFLMFEGPKED